MCDPNNAASRDLAIGRGKTRVEQSRGWEKAEGGEGMK